MDEAAIAVLRCPYCRASLAASGNRLGCTSGHSFDVARQGYVNLSGPLSSRLRPDTTDMVQARRRFLARGRFETVQQAVTGAVRSAVEGAGPRPGRPDGPATVLVELGSGTAAYLAHAMTAIPRAVGIGLDLSIPAARVAARAHPRAAAVVADVWRELPLGERVADVVLVVFAPRNMAEIARVLRPAGSLVIATPGVDHLREITEPLALLQVPPGKGATAVGHGFEEVATGRVHHQVTVTPDDCYDLVAMGPNAWHSDLADVRTWADVGPDERQVTIDVTVRTFRAG